MLLWLFLISGLILAFAYRRSLQPVETEPGGPWRIVDPRDGPLRSFVSLWAVLLGTSMAFNMLRGVWLSAAKHPGDALFFLLLCLGLYGLLWWTEGRKLLEAVYARPGALYVPQWPLQAGEQVEVTYRRYLRRGRLKGEVNAALVLWTRRRRQDILRDRILRRHVRSQEVPLPDGEASVEGRELVATWRFKVPESGRYDAPIFGRRHLFGQLLGFYSKMDYWELFVDVPLSGHLRLDSRIRLDIDFVTPYLPEQHKR